MGRDTTARKRMSLKRSREKSSGLRRLNVALTKEAFDKLAELMKLHNSSSQARLIEHLILNNSIASETSKAEEERNIVIANKKEKAVVVNKELLPAQMSLFGS